MKSIFPHYNEGKMDPKYWNEHNKEFVLSELKSVRRKFLAIEGLEMVTNIGVDNLRTYFEKKKKNCTIFINVP